MNTSSLTWADVTTPVFVSKLNWPPKSTGNGAIPQVPPMDPPDFTIAPEYKFDISQSENICRDKWTKRGELDRRMFAYCVGREQEGYVATLKKFRKHDWIASTFPAIWAKWTNGGNTLYSQVAFNLKNEGEAFLDYVYASKEAAFDSAKMAGCESEWAEHPSRWSMTMHCYKN